MRSAGSLSRAIFISPFLRRRSPKPSPGLTFTATHDQQLTTNISSLLSRLQHLPRLPTATGTQRIKQATRDTAHNKVKSRWKNDPEV